jgi:hypothetical protein
MFKLCVCDSHILNYLCEKKGEPFLSFVIATGFCTDMTQHVNELNTNLQGANHLIKVW